MTKPTVLIVEDEAPLNAMLRYNLEKEGFQVCKAGDGEEGLAEIAAGKPDIVLLDWTLPLVANIEVCREIRRSPNEPPMPVIILRARGKENGRVGRHNSGTDKYMVKPFNISELVAQLRAMIRPPEWSKADEVLQFADVTMNLAAYRVSRAGKPIHLGPTEFRLLRHLMRFPQRVFSREQLLYRLWGRDGCVGARTVDTHIGRLRKALNAHGDSDIVRTIRSAGYLLDHP